MPVYRYKGLRPDGKSANGIVDADSPRGARLQLRKGGIYTVELAEHRRITGAEGQARTQAQAGKASSLSSQDVAILTRQLGTLLAAGLPLVEAFGVLVDQSDRRVVQTLLADVREQIREGRALSLALEAYPQDFKPYYRHMVRAGEASGALDQVLLQLAEFLEHQLALRHKVTNAALYPMVMFAVSVAVLFFLMTFVVPKIVGVFADLHQALPLPTRLLIMVSGLLGRYWIFILGGIVLLVVGLRRALRTPAGRAYGDRLLLKLPILGEVARKVAISRLTNTLSMVLSSGIPLLEALDMSKRVMNNTVLEQSVEVAREHIREGESVAEPLKRSGAFPPLVTHMIAVGERTGEMEAMLLKVSQIYDSEVDRAITRLTSLLEPIMILVMGVVVLFIVVSILLPIFEMSQIVR